MKIFYLIFFLCTLIPHRVFSAQELSYEIKPTASWEETDAEGAEDEITNYSLKSSKNVVMNFSYLDQDLNKETETRALDSIVKDMVSGKNFIYGLMGVEDHKVTDKRLVKTNQHKILTIESQYRIGQETFFLLEKFYIIPNKVLMTSLRWTSQDLSATDYAKALNDFKSIQVRVK